MRADPDRLSAPPAPEPDVAETESLPSQPVSPGVMTPESVLALSRTGGNRAVTGYLARARVLARAPGPLTAAQERAAIAAARAQLAANGVRVVQEIVNTVADGSFGPITAQAVATFQGANALTQDGLINRATLDALVTSAVAGAMQDEAIFMVADWENLDIRTDTLTVRFDSTLAAGTDSALARQGGNLRVITIGASAFATSTRLGTAIRTQLTVANPAAAPAAAAPATLSARAAAAATQFNRSKFRDARSVQIIQSQIGSPFTGAFTNDDSQRITVIQAAAGLVVDGKVGEATMAELVTRLGAAGQQDAAIRIIIDFHRFNEDGLLDIAFDPTLAGVNAATGSAQIPGPTTIRVSAAGFAQGYAALVHTIAHELEHTRQRRTGMQNQSEREFLGERIEILSRGMVEEDFAGVVDDAGRALAMFNAMPAALRKTEWTHFVEVRNKVRARFAAAPAADQAANAALLANYNAVVKPP